MPILWSHIPGVGPIRVDLCIYIHINIYICTYINRPTCIWIGIEARDFGGWWGRGMLEGSGSLPARGTRGDAKSPKSGPAFGCLKWASKSVQVLFNGKEAAMVLTLIILK